MSRSLTVIALLIVFMCSHSSAQITIPSNPYNPAVGSLHRTTTSDISASLYNSVTSGSGGGHIWDFSSVTFNEMDTSYIVDCATAPKIGQFPAANLCQMQAEGGDSVWTYTASEPTYVEALGVLIRGQGIDDVTTVYENSTPDYVFPIAYGDTWVAYKHWTQSFGPGFETDFADTTFYEVDAFGQFKIGSITRDCLRVKATMRTWTSFTTGAAPAQATLTEIFRYDFVTPDLLDVITVSKSGAGLDTTYGIGTNAALLEETFVTERHQSVLPEGFSVGQNYPNPFNPSTSIDFSIPEKAHVAIDVINVLGRTVETIDLGQQPAGQHTVTFDMNNDVSRELPSGVYFYRLSAGDFSATHKMLLLK